MAEKFWDKFGFQRLQQNQAFMRCRPDVMGVFMQLRIMAGNSTYEDGSIPIGSVKRAKMDDILDYLTDFGDAKDRNAYRKRIERLVKVGVLSVTAGKVVKIAGYEEEQSLGRTVDANRKRAEAQVKFQENVNRCGTFIKTVFKQSGARALPYDMLHSSIRNRTGVIKKTADSLLGAMIDNGVLVCVADGLYSLATLAPPPAGAGAGSAGTGAENPVRNFPLESEPESESELEAHASSAGSAGTRPRSSYEEARGPAPEAERGRSERSEADGLVVYPEDAHSVPDPLHASAEWLRPRPGWCEDKQGDKPSSRMVLLKRWKDLRTAVGVRDAERIWRQALFDILVDDREKQTWRSWVAGFISKVKIAQECCESLKGVGAGQ